MESNNALAESTTDPTNLCQLFPPKENLATAIIAITIHGIGETRNSYLLYLFFSNNN